uniref:Protein kinase domain-containing protein n=1 Tax=Physcomitrium patens TaxID=3218 RepID=A0A7I4EWQ0_PHYPA
MLIKYNPNKFKDNMCGTFDVATWDEVEGDENYLYEKLIFEIEESFQEHGLKHLLQRWKDLHYMEVRKFNALKLPSNMKNLKIMDSFGKGSFRKVCKAKWLRLDCVVKKMDVGHLELFIKEVAILASISHLNLIKYFFAIEGDANEKK